MERVVAAVAGKEAGDERRLEPELGAHAFRRPQLDLAAVRLDQRRLLADPTLDTLVVREEEPSRRAVIAVDLLSLDDSAEPLAVAEGQPEDCRCLAVGHAPQLGVAPGSRSPDELQPLAGEAPVEADRVLGHELEVAAVAPARLGGGIAGVDDRDAQPPLPQVIRGRCAGEAGPDDEHVDDALEPRPRPVPAERVLAAQPVRRVVGGEHDRLLRRDSDPGEQVLEGAARAGAHRRGVAPAQLRGQLRCRAAARVDPVGVWRMPQLGPCTRNVENCQTSSSGGRGRAKPANESGQRRSGVQSDCWEAIGPRYGRA